MAWIYHRLALALALSLALALFCSGSLAREIAPKLGSYLIAKDLISVSGISSGGAFGVQFHVAFSGDIMGAGILAGVPYWCAQSSRSVAITSCMKYPDRISVAELVDFSDTAALTFNIDSLENLKDDRVYVFAGSKDTLVNPGVSKKLAEYYSAFLSSSGLYTEFSIPAEHSMVTDDYGNPCNVLAPPYIINCNYSAAYHLLQHIYGDVAPVNDSMTKTGNLLEFDQSEFFLDVPNNVSMDTTGYIYVPTRCQSRTSECRLHLAFHGCKSGRVYISDTFALHAGYNAIAEMNDIIVLYPQAINSTVLVNPNGCWDWWGFTSDSYVYKTGAQMSGVKLMVDRIAGF